MKTEFNIAVLGATGTVGETILRILEERKFPVGTLYALASHRSAGDTIIFQNKSIVVENADGFDFSKVDIALFSAGGNTAAHYAPIATAQGCIVIDNSSMFRYEKEIPLIITEVNSHAIERYKNRKIIANPNCSTMQMLVALKPIYDAVGIDRINVATYQSVSGTGRRAISELVTQTTQLINGKNIKPEIYSKQIAFNALPHIDAFEENGYTREEMKLHWETQKILEDHEIRVNATAVRIPVFYGHSEAVHIETKNKITAKQARDLLANAPGIVVIDDIQTGLYPTAVTHASGTDPVFVGRIREDFTHPRGLDLWIVADNIRKGAALNAVQIAELLLEKL